MIEYIYKGFKMAYKIIPSTAHQSYYKADGTATYLLNAPKLFKPKKFHIEDTSFSAAEHEIKKLLENHVNVELKKFYEMKNKSQEER